MFIKKNPSGFISQILDFFDKHNLIIKAKLIAFCFYLFL